jgi:hypothetical protein
MNQAPPIETRLLGLTPREYQQLKRQARNEARLLRREAISATIDFFVDFIVSLPAWLRTRRAARAVSAV